MGVELISLIEDIRKSGLVVPSHVEMDMLTSDMSDSPFKNFPNVMMIYLDGCNGYKDFLYDFKENDLGSCNFPKFCVPLIKKFSYFNNFCATQKLPDFRFTKVELRKKSCLGGEFHREFFDNRDCDVVDYLSKYLKTF